MTDPRDVGDPEGPSLTAAAGVLMLVLVICLAIRFVAAFFG